MSGLYPNFKIPMLPLTSALCLFGLCFFLKPTLVIGQTVLTIEGGHFVQGTSGTLQLNEADFINNGNYLNEGGLVYFTGQDPDAQSVIGGDSISHFDVLEVFKDGTVRLEQNIIVDNEFIIQNGFLDLNGDTLTFGTPEGFIEGDDEDYRIIGPNGGVVQITIDPNGPINTTPGSLGLRITSSQNLGPTLIQREYVPVALNDTLSIEAIFKVFPTNNANLDATLRFEYWEAELNGHDEATLGSWKRDSAFWYNPGGTPAPNSNRVTLTNVDVLSEFTLAPNAPAVDLRVFLAGSYDDANLEMTDELRAANLIPTTEPYTELGYTFPASGGGEQINPQVFNISGSDAIVDWVFVELLDAIDPTTVIAARAALLQKDGDVVDLDGRSTLSFPEISTAQSPLISVRHRNHVGVIAESPVDLSNGPVVLDFTIDPDLAAGGAAAFIDFGNGHYGLISGDFNGDGQVQNTDFNALSLYLGSSGYKSGDLDLNGQVQNSDIQIKLTPNLGRGAQFGY
ncbi:MAG: hypothetical protein AAFV80_08945 [Bacteroidota bacterium]